MTAPAGDAASVTVFVAVAPEDAFAVFTQEIDAWWRHGPQYRIGGRHPGRLRFEPEQRSPAAPGGVLVEIVDLPGGPRRFEVGRVMVWQPPARLDFEWRGVNFKDDEVTLVEVVFRPQGDGTLVTVRHSGWSSLRDGHPARHGLAGAAFARMIGLWWGELMSGLREWVATRDGG
jgi:uncharacterized protein YndB with AHSA1/START domain